MLSIILILIGVFLIVYQFVDIDKEKKEKHKRSLSFEDKRFFMALSKSLPSQYTVAYESEGFRISELYEKFNVKKSLYGKLKSLLSKRVIDFVVLNEDFEICCIIDFSGKDCQVVNEEFIELSGNLGIRVFKFCLSEDYDFTELLNHLKNK